MSTDQSDGGPDDGPDDGPEDTGPEAGGEPGAPGGESRRRRRRRRRRGGDASADPNASSAPRGAGGPQGGAPSGAGAPSASGPGLGGAAGDRERRQWQSRGPARLSEGAPGASVKVAADAGVDAGWDEPAESGAAPAEASSPAATDGAGSEPRGEREGRRRRRRGRDRDRDARGERGPGRPEDRSALAEGADEGAGNAGDAAGGGASGPHEAGQPGEPHGAQGPRDGNPRGARDGGGQRGDQRGTRDGGGQRGDQRGPRDGNPRGARDGGGQRGARDGQRTDPQGQRGGGRDGGQRGGRGDRRGGGDRPRSEDPRHAQLVETDDTQDAAQIAAAIAATPYEAPTTRLAQAPRKRDLDDPDDAAPETPSERWGVDDDGPAKVVELTSGWPEDAPGSDPDPVSFPLLASGPAPVGEDVVSVVGVRFVVGGRIQWCDAADADYALGEKLIVDSERGPRLGTVAAPPQRRATRDRQLRRVIRRAHEGDLAGEREGDAERTRLLRAAKDAAAHLRMPLKVYRVELAGERGRGGKLNVYYTSDERLDLRDLVRDLGNATGMRIELRQLGVRDEAKAVGGIGSCGLTLCCTTWMPDFVPVSIKMAKDQGLVLSPTKVAGQCGRLKCCLVYEQQGYAEMRKGLPKLGKRVISPRGEGRVVEVDVLRQRVRVSYGFGDTEVLPATEVKPLFPSGNQPPREKGDRPPRRDAAPTDDDDDESDDPPTDDPSALPPPIDEALLGADDDDLGPTDDPSSDHYKPE